MREHVDILRPGVNRGKDDHVARIQSDVVYVVGEESFLAVKPKEADGLCYERDRMKDLTRIDCQD